jgi:hypothetical protein
MDNWLTSIIPIHLLIIIHRLMMFWLLDVQYFTFLEGASTLKHTDKALTAYANRGQEGWRDYLLYNLQGVKAATKPGQDNYLSHIAPSIAWPQSKSVHEKKSSGLDKSKTIQLKVKNLCGRHLGSQIKAHKGDGVIITCNNGKHGKKCPNAHLLIASFTRAAVKLRLLSVPTPLREVLEPFVQAFKGFKK